MDANPFGDALEPVRGDAARVAARQERLQVAARHDIKPLQTLGGGGSLYDAPGAPRFYDLSGSPGVGASQAAHGR